MKKKLLVISAIFAVFVTVFFFPRHRKPEEVPPLNYDSIFSTLTIPQLSEIIYNADRENWDTITVKEIVETYLINPSYYEGLKECGDTIYLNGVTIL